jgi:cyclomaltodextrin glucanotransferase
MRRFTLLALSIALAGCATAPTAPLPPEWFGTLDPFAEHAIYFVVTDRYANGDPNNDQRTQGGAHPTFELKRTCPDGTVDAIGYMGGDFRGLLDHAGDIKQMGFGAVWITPVIDNPNEAFTGGDPITCDSFLTDRGKAGYHGYWGMNFFREDEHLVSAGLGFKEFASGMRGQGLKVVLDIVANHSSPAFTMPVKQPGFGQVFDQNDRLVADHDNLKPEQLDPRNPLHTFYNRKPDLAQLGDFNGDNPAVRDYLARAYLHWIEQGADAFRIDTIRHQPFSYWRDFSQRIRSQHPGFFMFGEAFDSKPENIAAFTKPENGAISVLDFPLKDAMLKVFENAGSDYAELDQPLYLTDGPYHNPYELATFYDNHDMARMNASDAGFIDAHHWLFTARGIPVIYYGSEIGFMRGRKEHHGNRNYFGPERIAESRSHPIRQALTAIAKVRGETIALQRGLQLNLSIKGDHAVFVRVYAHQGVEQTALVMLNKGSAPATLRADRYLPIGDYREALTDARVASDGAIEASVPANGARVFVVNQVAKDRASTAALVRAMTRKRR